MRSDTSSGTEITVGAKFRIDDTPAATSRSATSCAADAGRGDDADGDAVLRGDRGQVVDVAHDDAVHLGADDARVGVDSATIGKPALAEPAVVGEGLPEVAEPDDGDRPVLREAELAAHLEQQVLDVVARRRGCRRTRGTRGPCGPWRRSRRPARPGARRRSWRRRLCCASRRLRR